MFIDRNREISVYHGKYSGKEKLIQQHTKNQNSKTG